MRAVVVDRDFTAIEHSWRSARASGADYDAHYRTPTISRRAGRGALANAALLLDWQGDGRGYQRHDYTASPTV
ncbi:hypothetical protein ABZY44_34860 [Streptomyces sp. NPDC006544]|uniref:hypothetical protein n=1 Tax=Streptomyces sp. NPDC006544 TaxID=3154583 RepID=UPI0033B2EDEC